MNWLDVLPWTIARQQIAWERKRRAARMRDVGFIYAVIGKELRVSTERARQLVIGGRQRSPAEEWLSRDIELKAPLVGGGPQTIKRLRAVLNDYLSHPAILAHLRLE